MSIEHSQLRRLIQETLSTLAGGSGLIALYTPEAVKLLMLTAAQESHCGKYIEQVMGPALGIFQMEPATYDDIYKNFLAYRPALKAAVESMRAPGLSISANLRGNIPYQIALARVHYYRSKHPIPYDTDGIRKFAVYYKLVYNTPLGKATVEEAIHNYNIYVNGKEA